MLKSVLCLVLMIVSTLSQAQDFRWSPYQPPGSLVVYEEVAGSGLRRKAPDFVSTPIVCETEVVSGPIRSSPIRSPLRATSPSCLLVCPTPGAVTANCRVVIQSIATAEESPGLHMLPGRSRGAFEAPDMRPPATLSGR